MQAVQLLPTCGFYNVTSGQYAAQGCGTMPNPYPPAGGLFWRDISEAKVAFPAAAREVDAWWGIGNAGYNEN